MCAAAFDIFTSDDEEDEDLGLDIIIWM